MQTTHWILLGVPAAPARCRFGRACRVPRAASGKSQMNETHLACLHAPCQSNRRCAPRAKWLIRESFPNSRQEGGCPRSSTPVSRPSAHHRDRTIEARVARDSEGVPGGFGTVAYRQPADRPAAGRRGHPTSNDDRTYKRGLVEPNCETYCKMA
jgi:hypothetical protein